LTVASGQLVMSMEVGPIVGSGVLVYNTPLAGARTELKGDAYPAAIGSFSNYVDKLHPSTERSIEGWHFDERIWYGEDLENEVNTVPTNFDPTTSGITATYFQSGIGSDDDLELQRLLETSSSGVNVRGLSNVWSPEILHGQYYDFQRGGYLYADDSEVGYPTLSGIVAGLGHTIDDGYSLVTMSGQNKIGIPITIEQWEWDDEDGQYNTYLSLKKRVRFTGKKDADGVRQSTWNDITEFPIFENIDQTEPEFIVTLSGENPCIIMNDQYTTEVGSGIDVSVSGLELLGLYQGTAGEQLHTRFAPVDDSSGIEIYSYLVASGDVTTWRAVPFDATPSGFEVRVTPGS